MNSNTTTDYDVLVIGGGVVGCAVLRAATLAGWKCILVENETDLLSHARYGSLSLFYSFITTQSITNIK